MTHSYYFIQQEQFARVVRRVEALRWRHVSPAGETESARQGQALFQSLLAEAFG